MSTKHSYSVSYHSLKGDSKSIQTTTVQAENEMNAVTKVQQNFQKNHKDRTFSLIKVIQK
jgi:hypothetical protein